MADTLHPVDRVPPLPQLLPLALQHVLVMYAGAVAVPLIVGRALKLPPEQVAFLISADLFAGGLATLVQSFGLPGVGVRLPVMMGVTFASVKPEVNGNNRLAKVRERSIGILFFSIFGGLWLLVSFLAFGLLTRGVVLLLISLVLAFVVTAVWLMRSVPPEVEPDAQRERDGRMFGWVNAVQGFAIFLVFTLANHFHHGDVAFPLAVLIVGLHMFALPRSYRIPSNLITGALLVIAASLCMFFFRGDPLVGAVTLSAGIILWGSALWKLGTATLLLRTSESAAL